jgi:transposase
VRETLGSDPYSGVIYVFRAKRADRVKLLLWDGTGLVPATPSKATKYATTRANAHWRNRH